MEVRTQNEKNKKQNKNLPKSFVTYKHALLAIFVLFSTGKIRDKSEKKKKKKKTNSIFRWTAAPFVDNDPSWDRSEGKGLEPK